MLIQLSTWEISNISNLINSIYETYDCNLDKSSCLTIGWISYLECRNLYPYSLFSDDFIQYVSEKISASFSNLRTEYESQVSALFIQHSTKMAKNLLISCLAITVALKTQFHYGITQSAWVT